MRMRAGHRAGLLFLGLIMALGVRQTGAQEFVRREGNVLLSGTGRFLFTGANAYYLPIARAYGDSAAVDEVLDAARGLGMTVLRTWAFHDSPDSSDPGVFQYRPGVFNEEGLRALDEVVAGARRRGIRLLFPLVNNWDDYGGMNQYVRWRQEPGGPSAPLGSRYGDAEVSAVVAGGVGERYRVALSSTAGHDDFYTDPVIRGWFKGYLSMLLQRVNTVTGVAYRDEPAILGWELANEPRSSDPTGRVVAAWLEEMSAFAKSIDPNHLVGSGEEGGDVDPSSFPAAAREVPAWLLDGTTGVSFRRNSALANLDFASLHLYAETWSIPAAAGNSWIRDHQRLAEALGKPLVLGEIGAREGRAGALESWMTTALLGDAAGVLVWQLLDGRREDAEGYGIHCGGDPSCDMLRAMASLFAEKAARGSLPPPAALRLLPCYPNPASGQTILVYELPWDARVILEVYDLRGALVRTVVDDRQNAGVRKELFSGSGVASGAYLYRVRAMALDGSEHREASGKFTILH
jgi:mannan endo-1,4-beta-mannosidase